jgi:hypothetical protein
MPDPARVIDAALPVDIADAMETAGLSSKLATLMNIIEEFAKAKAGANSSPASAEPVEEMWALQKLLPVRVNYQKALGAAKSGAARSGEDWRQMVLHQACDE